MNHVVSPVLSSGSKIGLLLLLTIAGWQCLEAPNYPDEPYIEFLSLSKDTMDQGIFQQDSLIVRFRFEDGDGDIGRTDADPENNIFFIDERTGTLDNTFGIPTIPEDGAGNGVEGEVRIVLFPHAVYIPMAQTHACQMPSFHWIPYSTVFISRTGRITKAMKSLPPRSF